MGKKKLRYTIPHLRELKGNSAAQCVVGSGASSDGACSGGASVNGASPCGSGSVATHGSNLAAACDTGSIARNSRNSFAAIGCGTGDNAYALDAGAGTSCDNFGNSASTDPPIPCFTGAGA